MTPGSGAHAPILKVAHKRKSHEKRGHTVMNDLRISIATGTDVGKVRSDNQDTALNADGIYMVCDGMGGGVGGRQASAMTVRMLRSLEPLPLRSRGSIQQALDKAQDEVAQLGKRLNGIAGTTVTGLVLPSPPDCDSFDDAACWYVVNVGDSRTYHLDFDEVGLTETTSICRITKDHSQRQEIIDSGIMTPEVANATIPRNVITQAVGAPEGIRPDFYAVDPSGRFIICSDGLYSEVGDERIATISRMNRTPRDAVDALIQAALDAGGADNVTVIVVDAVNSEQADQRHWNATKLDDGEDIGSIGDGTLRNLRAQS